MPRKSTVFQQKIIKITPFHQQALDFFMDRMGFMTEADVWRQALLWFYKEHDTPEYRKLTPLQEIKYQKLAKTEKQASASPEEYNDEVVHGLKIKDAQTGKFYVLVHAWGNMLRPIPLEALKQTLEQMPDLLAYHLQRNAETSVADWFSAQGLSAIDQRSDRPIEPVVVE